MTAEILKQFSQIELTEIDPEKLRKATTEDEFMAVAVRLLVEAGSYVCVAASALPAKTARWNRDQAIVGGTLVRLYKLISAILDQTCQHRGETAFIFVRLAFEAIVNVKFMVEKGSPELFDRYVRHSLRHERRLFDLVQRNIADRGGEVLPIEQRMMGSIERVVKRAGLTIESLSPSDPKSWGGSLQQRSAAVGWEQTYLGMFGGPSQSIHGNWMDIAQYQLSAPEDGKDDEFEPDLHWTEPRPQPLLAIAKLTVQVVTDYFGHVVGGDDMQEIEAPLEALYRRIELVDEAHEKYLNAS
jgi:hypothetical protein